MPAEVTILPNGPTVTNRTRPSAETVTVAVGVPAGSRDEPTSLRGGSHWLEHIHFLGTNRYPSPAAIFSAISDVGGQINAFTSHETTTYYATVPAPRFGVALDVLAEMMQHPSFPSVEVERERGIVQEELRGGLGGDPIETGMDALAERLLGPLGQQVGGTVNSVGTIGTSELLAYGAERYVARNMVLAVVGPLTHAEVVAAAERVFTDLPEGKAYPAIAPSQAGGVIQNATDLNIAPLEGILEFTVVGQRIPGLNSPDAAALLVMDAILDVPGTRMRDALRQNRVTPSGGTRITLFSDAGIWGAYAVAGRNRACDAQSVVSDQIRRLQNELVSEAEVEAARTYLAGRYLLGTHQTTDQATHLAQETILGIYQTEKAFAARLRAVTAADVQRVARLYLNPDALSIVTVR